MRQKLLTRAGAIRSLLVIMLSIGLFSFSAKIGGDSFSIYLNGKLLLQEYVMRENKVKSISLADADTDDVLRIQYSHCGTIGAERTVSLRNDRNKVLKSWTFKDNSSPFMEVTIKDLLPLTKGVQNLKLVYTSREIPNGKILAGIAAPDGTKARLR